MSWLSFGLLCTVPAFRLHGLLRNRTCSLWDQPFAMKVLWLYFCGLSCGDGAIKVFCTLSGRQSTVPLMRLCGLRNHACSQLEPSFGELVVTTCPSCFTDNRACV
mmetsp:Transcript_151665/g.486643  ORF Transcript_151665/g.486643 Transcript_151665/m.486643 type:complete len:105 (+) Transcript_151665:95-409(+)